MSIVYKADAGAKFGKWSDPISRLIYFDCMPDFLDSLRMYFDQGIESVADYGGANGNLKHFLPNSVTIDIDESKNPDVLDNILTHGAKYDLVICRYVLHYLNPFERSNLIEKIKANGTRFLWLIQFTNDGPEMDLKKGNSINESKHFLTTSNLFDLVLTAGDVLNVDRISYEVTKEFYSNRLGNDNAIPHNEKCYSILMEL